MHRYFAYASNLSLRQMSRRCPSARVLATGFLDGYRMDFPRRSARWDNAGVAGVVASAGARVQGVVYGMSEEDLHALDVFEGVAVGQYRRVLVDVRLSDGGRMTVFTYFAAPESGGPFKPSQGYVDTMLEGARDHQLSKVLVSQLQHLAVL